MTVSELYEVIKPLVEQGRLHIDVVILKVPEDPCYFADVDKVYVTDENPLDETDKWDKNYVVLETF